MNRGDRSRAIVFDLDGTLVDMRALYLRANQLATKDVLGVELSEHEVHELMATGLPLRAAMRTLDENSADRPRAGDQPTILHLDVRLLRFQGCLRAIVDRDDRDRDVTDLGACIPPFVLHTEERE